MIIHSFDPDSPAMITPAQASRVDGLPKTVLVCFTRKFFEIIQSMAPGEEIGLLKGGRDVPVYRLLYGGREIGFYHTLIGGAASAALLEEIIANGAEKILFFGSCGALDPAHTAGGLIVPTQAYRDEGVSYHYAPAGDYIEIPTAGRLSQILASMGVPFVQTKTWTTDAFYRETKSAVAARRSEGCGTVEMECASVTAVGRFRGVEVYQFLYAADSLASADWDRRILGAMPEDMRAGIAKIALETAIRL